MKRIKLNIKTSDRGDYEYFIYRSTDPTTIPSDLDLLSVLEPNIKVQEDVIEHIAYKVSDIANVDKSKLPSQSRLPYSLKHFPILSIIHDVTFSVIVNENLTRNYIVKFNSDSQPISFDRIEDDSTVTSQPLEYITFMNKTLYLSEIICGITPSVYLEYYIEMIEIYDDNEMMIQGITQFLNEATGLAKPIANLSLMTVTTSDNTELPFLSIKPTAGDSGQNYYYRMVAVDSLGNISEPSNLLATILSQSANEILYNVECCDSYTSNDTDVWRTIIYDLRHEEFNTIGKIDTPEYLKNGAICFFDFNILNSNLASVDETRRDLMGNDVVVSFPNIWVDSFSNPFLSSTRYKAYRVKTKDVLGNVSEPTEAFVPDGENIQIEKVIVYKKTVTLDQNPTDPLPYNDGILVEGITKPMEFILRNGKYYNVIEHGELDYNQEVPPIDYTVSIIDTLSIFSDMSFVSQGCLIGQRYNFTFFLVDSFGNVSDGIPFFLDTLGNN